MANGQGAVSKAFHSDRVQRVLEWWWAVAGAMVIGLGIAVAWWYTLQRTDERAVANESAIAVEVAERMDADKEIWQAQSALAEKMGTVNVTLGAVNATLSSTQRSIDNLNTEIRELRRERRD